MSIFIKDLPMKMGQDFLETWYLAKELKFATNCVATGQKAGFSHAGSRFINRTRGLVLQNQN